MTAIAALAWFVAFVYCQVWYAYIHSNSFYFSDHAINKLVNHIVLYLINPWNCMLTFYQFPYFSQVAILLMTHSVAVWFKKLEAISNLYCFIFVVNLLHEYDKLCQAFTKTSHPIAICIKNNTLCCYSQILNALQGNHIFLCSHLWLRQQDQSILVSIGLTKIIWLI